MRQPYNDFYEKKYNRKRRMQTLAIVVMLIITVAVLALGFRRSNEQKAQLVEEGEQYYSNNADTNEE